MKNYFLLLLCIVVLASCSTTKKTIAVPEKQTAAAKNPQFIKSISTKPSGNNKSTPTISSKNIVTTYTSPHINYGLFDIEQFIPVQFKYAVMMNAEVEALSNKKLFEFIDDWYGTRYRYGGNTKQGIDCSGFSGTLMSNVYGTTLLRTASEQYQQVEKINSNDLKEGDLVFFNTSGGVSHVGVYLANNKFVHASTSSGVMISDLNEVYYNKRFLGGGRVKK